GLPSVVVVAAGAVGHGRLALALRLRVAPLEPFDPAPGVDQLLLAGIERVALRAQLDMDLRAGRTGLERVPTGAAHDAPDVLGVDPLLHVAPSFRVVRRELKRTRGRSRPSAPRRSGGTPGGRCGLPGPGRPSRR